MQLKLVVAIMYDRLFCAVNVSEERLLGGVRILVESLLPQYCTLRGSWAQIRYTLPVLAGHGALASVIHTFVKTP